MGSFEAGLLEGLQGSQYLVWYFRLLGCSIGRDVCLYPNGGDPMMTGTMILTTLCYLCRTIPSHPIPSHPLYLGCLVAHILCLFIDLYMYVYVYVCVQSLTW
jgi:hypothetical protein